MGFRSPIILPIIVIIRGSGFVMAIFIGFRIFFLKILMVAVVEFTILIF